MIESVAEAELPDWLATLAARAPSVRAEALSRFLPPEDGSGRDSAVLIAFGDVAGEPSVLLLQRAADMRKHPGQVAFPGGAVDLGDLDAPATAVREATEEVGLDPSTVRLIAALPAIFLPATRFVVTPVLAWWQRPHPVHAVDSSEVARAAVVPIAGLVAPENRFQSRHPSGWLGPAFEIDGLFIWGFTAGLLSRVLDLGGWTLAWDQSRQRELPAQVAGRSVLE